MMMMIVYYKKKNNNIDYSGALAPESHEFNIINSLNNGYDGDKGRCASYYNKNKIFIKSDNNDSILSEININIVCSGALAPNSSKLIDIKGLKIGNNDNNARCASLSSKNKIFLKSTDNNEKDNVYIVNDGLLLRINSNIDCGGAVAPKSIKFIEFDDANNSCNDIMGIMGIMGYPMMSWCRIVVIFCNHHQHQVIA